MISRKIFTWFDSSTVKQLKLIYAIYAKFIREFSIMPDLSGKETAE